MEKKKFEWEKLMSGTFRAPVFGGWILRTRYVPDDEGDRSSPTMVFIPDANHEWEVEEI